MHKIAANFLFFLLFAVCFLACETSGNKTDSADIPVQIVHDSTQISFAKLPMEITYCGERIALDQFDIRERLDKELIVNTYYHSSTIQILKRANRYFPTIERILKEEGVPDDLKYVCVIESALLQATSPSGAKGFWQFMKGTAKEYELEVSKEIDERMHVEKSTRAACDYLKTAHRKFDNWVMASASYNCGVAGLKRKVDEQEQSNFFDLYLNRETSRYVLRILALKIIMETPEEYGFYPEKMELYEPVAVRKVKVNEDIANLSKWANKQGANLRLLKVLNPWLVSNKLTCNGKTYYIELPE